MNPSSVHKKAAFSPWREDAAFFIAKSRRRSRFLADRAVDAVGKLITAGAVTDGKLDLSYDMLRLIVIGLRFTRHAR